MTQWCNLRENYVVANKSPLSKIQKLLLILLLKIPSFTVFHIVCVGIHIYHSIIAFPPLQNAWSLSDRLQCFLRITTNIRQNRCYHYLITEYPVLCMCLSILPAYFNSANAIMSLQTLLTASFPVSLPEMP